MSDKPTPTAAPVTASRKQPGPRKKTPKASQIAAPAATISEADGDEAASEDFDSFVPTEVVDVVVTLPNPNPVLVLRSTDQPQRTFSIPIGIAEGTSIANALRQVSTPKPLTHELFAEALTALGASIAVARITAVEGGAFYAEIVLSGGSSGQQEIACRPSDAVAMALRQRPPAPIVTASSVLDAVGVEGVANR